MLRVVDHFTIASGSTKCKPGSALEYDILPRTGLCECCDPCCPAPHSTDWIAFVGTHYHLRFFIGPEPPSSWTNQSLPLHPGCMFPARMDKFWIGGITGSSGYVTVVRGSFTEVEAYVKSVDGGVYGYDGVRATVQGPSDTVTNKTALSAIGYTMHYNDAYVQWKRSRANNDFHQIVASPMAQTDHVMNGDNADNSVASVNVAAPGAGSCIYVTSIGGGYSNYVAASKAIRWTDGATTAQWLCPLAGGPTQFHRTFGGEGMRITENTAFLIEAAASGTAGIIGSVDIAYYIGSAP